MKTNKPLTPAQTRALKQYAIGVEHPDIWDYWPAGSLAFANRERVIDALKRKGFIDDDGDITDAGLAALSRLES